MAVGAAVSLVRHGFERPVYQVLRGESGDLNTVPGILADGWHGRGRGVIQWGLLLLIATPVTRVVLSVAPFAAPHDRRYVQPFLEMSVS